MRAARGLWGAFEDPGPPHFISRWVEKSDNDFGPGRASPGVCLDYDVFLLVRVTEYREEGLEPLDAIRHGICYDVRLKQ